MLAVKVFRLIQLSKREGNVNWGGENEQRGEKKMFPRVLEALKVNPRGVY